MNNVIASPEGAWQSLLRLLRQHFVLPRNDRRGCQNFSLEKVACPLFLLCFLLFFVINSGRVGVCSLKEEKKLLEEKLTSAVKQPGISFLGEKLIYDVKWSGTSLLAKILSGKSVGELILEVKEKLTQTNGQSVYLFSWKLRTAGIYSWFFSWDEKRENFVDGDTLWPYRVTIYRKEGSNPLKDWVIEIDQKIGEALIRNEKNGQEYTKLFSSPVFDIPSLIYWLRTQKLEIGREFPFFLLEDESPEACKKRIGEEVQIKVLKKEEVLIHDETYSAFLCKEVGSGKIKVWFWEDEGYLPVKIEVDVGEGTFITASLNRGESTL